MNSTNASNSRIFESITSLVKARDLVEDLGPSLTSSMTLDDAHCTLMAAVEKANFSYDLFDRVSLVYEDEHVIGWYTADMYDNELAAVRDVFQQIYPSEIVAADTTIFRLVNLLSNRPRGGIILFILDEDSIIGTVSPSIFNTPVFRLCLFSLTLELESSALRAALTNPLASWNALSEGRRNKAQDVVKNQNVSHEPDPFFSTDVMSIGSLLSATMFVDKGTIVSKGCFLPDRQPRDVKSLFNVAERVRNWCAHTRDSSSHSPLGYDAEQVDSFVNDCMRTISALDSFAHDCRPG